LHLSGSEATLINLEVGGNEARDSSSGHDIFATSSSYTCSTSCGLGQFSDCGGLADTNTPTFECHVNCGGCHDCPAGTANDATGATSPAWCVECGPGYVSEQAGSTECTSCNPGTYATDANEMTKYGVVSRATQCVECPVGSSQPQNSSVYCSTCDPGRSAVKGR